MSRTRGLRSFLGNPPEQWQARCVGNRQLVVWAAVVVTAALTLGSCGGAPHPNRQSTTTVRSTPVSTQAPSSTTTTAPKEAAVGQKVTIGGLSMTLVTIVDPLKLGPNTFLNPGQRAIGIDLVVMNVGADATSPDVSGGLTVYAVQGDAYEANMSAKLNGVPNFPIGPMKVQPGQSESGWIEVQLPTADPVAKVVVTISTSSTQEESATWVVTGS